MNMEIIQLIRTLFGSMDSEYIQQNDDKIIDLLEWAANTLEKLLEENKQLRNDLIMQTALAEVMTFPKIPLNVTLNEYVEIAKYYSTPKSSSFINGILASIINNLKQQGRLLKND